MMRMSDPLQIIGRKTVKITTKHLIKMLFKSKIMPRRAHQAQFVTLPMILHQDSLGLNIQIGQLPVDFKSQSDKISNKRF